MDYSKCLESTRSDRTDYELHLEGSTRHMGKRHDKIRGGTMPASFDSGSLDNNRSAQPLRGNWLAPECLSRRREVLEDTVYGPVADPLSSCSSALSISLLV